MNRHPRTVSSAWLRHGVALTAVVVLAAGCTAVNRLREAQDAFNQGAAAENAQRLAPGDATDTITSLTAVRTSYASALQSLEKISDEEKTSLSNDGLWGAALTLKALCQWRLGEYDKALHTANEAKTNASAQIYPRDQALLLALPGLIKTDQAYAKTMAVLAIKDDADRRRSSDQVFPEVKDLLVGPSGAVEDIKTARRAVGSEHPVQAYLIQGQLAAYRNYQVAAFNLQNGATIAPEDPARKEANESLMRLNQLLKELSTEDTQRTRLVQYWAKLCALPVPA